MIPRRRMLTILAAAALMPGASAPGRAAPPLRVWEGQALGAPVRIGLAGDPGQTRAGLAVARLALAETERRFSLFRADSDLVRLNHRGGLPDLDADWRGILALCDRIHAATGGLFDPTIQPLWLALARGADPGPARAAVGWHRLALPGAGRRALALGPGQALTLDGIAQGWAADRVRAALAAAGLTRALIDAGETVALGGPFRLALADPEQGRFGALALGGTALAVSSPAALRFADGQGHILAPRPGLRPVWSSVAVEAEGAALADGLSTAACLMPEPALRAALAALPEVRRILALAPDGRRLRLARA